jgi:hypothetical protein
MWTKLFNALKRGIWVPLAWDGQTKQLSFRLWCASFAFHIAVASVVALHFWPVEIASWTAMSLYALTMVFYMLQALTKAKIDLDDKSIELEDSSEEKHKEKEEKA